jgi:hypothetical protein
MQTKVVFEFHSFAHGWLGVGQGSRGKVWRAPVSTTPARGLPGRSSGETTHKDAFVSVNHKSSPWLLQQAGPSTPGLAHSASHD